MKYIAIILSALIVSCSGGDDGDGGGGSGNGGTNVDRLAGTASQNPNCATLTGATAVYFDLESGFLVNLPFLPLLESVGSTLPGGDASFWSLPPGYAGQTLERGVTIQRDDGEVFFKHTSGEQVFVDAVTAFDNQLSAAFATFQLSPDAATLICGLDIPFSVGPLPGRLISGLYEAGQRTFIIKIQVIDATGVLSLNTKVAAGPTQEFDQLAGNVFLPMVWAQFPGGSGPQPQCNDGMDNDGDLEVDFPFDPECTTPDDDDERNP